MRRSNEITTLEIPPSQNSTALFDMHVHLSFSAHPHELALALNRLSLYCLSASVTLDDYLQSCELFSSLPRVRVGLGMHPWWVSDVYPDEEQMQAILSQVAETALISEIGLDFFKTRNRFAQTQIEVFDQIVEVCAHTANHVLSVHCVRSVQQALDILEKYHTFDNNVVIMHSFNGTIVDLQRAQNAGCYFSVGSRFISNSKSLALLKAIEPSRLMLESDMPLHQGDDIDVCELQSDLQNTLDYLEAAFAEGLSSSFNSSSYELFKML